MQQCIWRFYVQNFHAFNINSLLFQKLENVDETSLLPLDIKLYVAICCNSYIVTNYIQFNSAITSFIYALSHNLHVESLVDNIKPHFLQFLSLYSGIYFSAVLWYLHTSNPFRRRYISCIYSCLNIIGQRLTTNGVFGIFCNHLMLLLASFHCIDPNTKSIALQCNFSMYW